MRYVNSVATSSLMAILLVSAYETFTLRASHRRALSYATAGANPKAFANGLGTALSANTR